MNGTQASNGGQPSWLAWLWYEAWRIALTFLMVFGFSVRVTGSANLRRRDAQGPLLVISNHQSFLDPPVIGVAASRQLCFLARKTLFRNPVFSWFIRSFNAAPVDQEGIGIEGLRIVMRLLEEKQAVVIFPEGERSPAGDFVPLKPGILLLLRKSKAPIIPVGIAGAYEAWPRWRPMPHFAPLFLPGNKAAIGMAVGKPFDANHLSDLPRAEALKELFAVIKEVYEQAEKIRRKW